MKKRLSILPLLLSLLLWTSCSDPKSVTDSLDRAEAWLDEHPDSAWTMLNTISVDEMGQNRNRARYALLYTQAQDKNYIDETNDSLITVAVDYYRHTGDVRRQFLSYYYKGRVLSNAGDYLNATSCYMEAEQLADEVEDDYQLGLLYAELGRIYRLYYDYPKSLEAHRKAGEHYERAGKIRHRNYMWYNQSTVYRNLNQYNEGEQLLRKTLALARENKDTTLAEICMGDLVMLCVEEERMKEARTLYAELEKWVDVEFGSPSFMSKLALMYATEQNFTLANECLEKGWKRAKSNADSVSLHIAASEVYDLQNDGKAAYEELQKGIAMQNKNTRQALQQPVLTAQCDYLSEKLEFEAYRLRMEKHLRILYILFFSLLLMVVVLWLFRKLKKEKEKARRTIDGLTREMLQKDKESRTKVASLLQKLEDQDKETSASIRQLRDELKAQEENYHQYMAETEQLQHELQEALERRLLKTSDVFKNWFEVMGNFVLLVGQKDVKEIYRMKNLLKEIDLIKEKYMSGNKAYRELERLVNAYHDDAMSHFRSEVSYSDELDYRRVCYFFAGLPVPTIAWLMDEKVDNLYQRRLRLRKFVASSGFPHKNLYGMLLRK